MAHTLIVDRSPTPADLQEIMRINKELRAALLMTLPYVRRVAMTTPTEPARSARAIKAEQNVKLIEALIARAEAGKSSHKEIPYNPAWTHGEIGADEAALMESNGWRMRPDGSYFKPGS